VRVPGFRRQRKRPETGKVHVHKDDIELPLLKKF
jgi:hypothetical protein